MKKQYFKEQLKTTKPATLDLISKLSAGVNTTDFSNDIIQVGDKILYFWLERFAAQNLGIKCELLTIFYRNLDKYNFPVSVAYKDGDKIPRFNEVSTKDRLKVLETWG